MSNNIEWTRSRDKAEPIIVHPSLSSHQYRGKDPSQVRMHLNRDEFDPPGIISSCKPCDSPTARIFDGGILHIVRRKDPPIIQRSSPTAKYNLWLSKTSENNRIPYNFPEIEDRSSEILERSTMTNDVRHIRRSQNINSLDSVNCAPFSRYSYSNEGRFPNDMIMSPTTRVLKTHRDCGDLNFQEGSMKHVDNLNFVNNSLQTFNENRSVRSCALNEYDKFNIFKNYDPNRMATQKVTPMNHFQYLSRDSDVSFQGDNCLGSNTSSLVYNYSITDCKRRRMS